MRPPGVIMSVSCCYAHFVMTEDTAGQPVQHTAIITEQDLALPGNNTFHIGIRNISSVLFLVINSILNTYP